MSGSGTGKSGVSTGNWTIETMAAALRSGKVNATELLSDASALIGLPAAEHVFVGRSAARAQAESGASTLRHAQGHTLGLLDGVPVCWKDLFDQTGERTGAGSATRALCAVADSDATVVAHLARAGAVSLGRTNTSEFAFSGIGINPHFGTPRNPWSPEVPCIPGGSSCGSAVAVALGIAPLALGTDTSGSVRVPAALNALVGYKPSLARISRQGVFALSPSLDSVGPITRTARDAVIADRALRGVETRGPIRSARAADLHLIVPAGRLCGELSAGVAKQFDASLDLLEECGARIIRRAVPALDAVFDAFEQHATLVGIEAASTLRAVVEDDAEQQMDHRVRQRLLTQWNASAHTLHSLLQLRQQLMIDVAADLGNALLVMPTTPETAPELQPLLDDDAAFFAMNARQLRNTMIGSYLDMPALALPNGFDERGMPTSLMLSGCSGQDERVLSAGVTVDDWLSGGRLRPLAVAADEA